MWASTSVLPRTETTRVSSSHPPHRPTRDAADAGALAFRTTSLGSDAVLAVEGEVDIHTAASLRRRLLELIDGGHDRVIVDMSGVDFMDSSGVNVLVGAMRAGR